jgi:hypothetical protein
MTSKVTLNRALAWLAVIWAPGWHVVWYVELKYAGGLFGGGASPQSGQVWVCCHLHTSKLYSYLKKHS